MSKIKTRTIDVQVKEKSLSGNTYFSARVVINLGLKGERLIYLPFQYGDWEQARFIGLDVCRKAGGIPEWKENYRPSYEDLRRLGIIFRCYCYPVSTEKQVRIWGGEF